MWHSDGWWLYLLGFAILIVLINHVFATIKRGQTLSTLHKAMDKGQPLSPEVLKELEAADLRGRGHHLQVGVIMIAVAIGIAAMSVLLRYGALADEPDGRKTMLALLAIAVIPATVGIATLILHAVSGRKGR